MNDQEKPMPKPVGGTRSYTSPPPEGRRSALLVIDVQNDFALPEGALSIKNGEEVVPVINNLRDNVGWTAIAVTQDWHPKNHTSFYKTHMADPNAKLFNKFTLESGEEQMLWPVHCVEDTNGADFHKDLKIESTDYSIVKGTQSHVDNYSAFYDNDHKSKTKLTDILNEHNVTDVYVVGLAFDYCVAFTALDAVSEGFRTFVVEDGCKSVAEDTAAEMKLKMEKAGVEIINSSLLLTNRDDPRQKAADYLQKHDIAKLFDKLCAQLVFHQPENPNEFLVDKLQKIQASPVRDLSSLSLFEAKDFDGMFNIMDPMGKGVVSKKQVIKSLEHMDIMTLSVKESIMSSPNENYSVDEFRKVAHAASFTS